MEPIRLVRLSPFCHGNVSRKADKLSATKCEHSHLIGQLGIALWANECQFAKIGLKIVAFGLNLWSLQK